MKFIALILVLAFTKFGFSLSINPPPSLATNMSVLVVDASNNNVVYEYNKDVPRLIASNMKLFSTLIALNTLGADYRWHTKLYSDGGVINNNELKGNLYLLGTGDPTFDSQALYQTFKQLKRSGVTKINGDIIVDDNIFSSKPTYSMLHTMDYDSDTVLPNGLLIDGNLTHLYINRQNVHGKISNSFHVSSDLYGYRIVNRLELDKTTLTECRSVYNHIHLNIVKNNLIVSGKLSDKCDNLELLFNLLPVVDYNKIKIKQVLDDLHLSLHGRYLHQSPYQKTNSSTRPIGKNLVYDHSSSSLEEILINMNRFSINITAETILLTSGTISYPKLCSYDAEQKLFDDFINSNHLSNFKAKLENGAGLSRYEYFSSQNIVDLLKIANSSLQQANFEASLAVSGQEGTLKNSFLKFKNSIHAKTGTLDDAKTLSGYFYSNSGKKYIFSILVNDIDTRDKENIKSLNNWIEQLFTEISK